MVALPVFLRRKLHIIAIGVPKDPVIPGRHTETIILKRHVLVGIEPFAQVHVLDAPGEPDHTAHEFALIVRIHPGKLLQRILKALLAAKSAKYKDRQFHTLPDKRRRCLNRKVISGRLIAKGREAVPFKAKADCLFLCAAEAVIALYIALGGGTK